MKLTAKEYLMQIEKLDTCINQRQVECDELRERMQSTGGISYDEKVQSSPRADALERRVVKYSSTPTPIGRAEKFGSIPMQPQLPHSFALFSRRSR